MSAYEVLLGSLLPALLAPLIAWFLAQRGAGRRSKELGDLLKRVELVERLSVLQKHEETTSHEYHRVLQAEAADVLADLAALRDTERLARATAPARMSLPRRWFLRYEQASWSAAIYRGLFYAFMLFALTVIATGPFIYKESNLSRSEQAIVMIGGSLFYGVLALLFRAAAVRRHSRALTKGGVYQAGAPPNNA